MNSSGQSHTDAGSLKSVSRRLISFSLRKMSLLLEIQGESNEASYTNFLQAQYRSKRGASSGPFFASLDHDPQTTSAKKMQQTS